MSKCSVVERERETYEELGNIPNYYKNSAGARYLPLFRDMTKAYGMGKTVLDMGCKAGSASVALAEAGYVPTMADLTDIGLTPEARRFPFHQVCIWDDLRGVLGFRDFVYCCDVMEHLPQEYTMLAIHRMLSVARFGVFLSIATVPDQFGAFVGKELHQTVKPYVWWRERLASMGQVEEARDLINTGVYWVTA